MMGTSRNEIRIRVQCTADENHGKILRFASDTSLEFLNALVALLDGTHRAYIHPPGEGSPIGRCAICKSRLRAEVERYDSEPPNEFAEALKGSLEKDAEHRKPVN